MLKALRYAEVLTRHRSYRQAAQSLGISQSQLSRVIQLLEKQLGTTLFKRDRLGVTLTPDGSLVLKEVPVLLKAEDDFKARIATIRDKAADGLQLGVGAIVSQSWMTTAVASIARRHPEISISARELDWWKLAESARSGEFDLVIGECSEAELDPHINVEQFPERGAGFFVRAGHPLDGRKELTIEQIAEFPLAAPRLPGRVGQFLPARSKLGHVSNDGSYFFPMIEAAAPRSIIDVVRASNAVGMSLRVLSAEALAAGAVVQLPIQPAWLCIRQGIMHSRHRPLTSGARAFRAAAKVAERSFFANRSKV